MIDTWVPGEPASVRAIATWLSPPLKDAINDFTSFCRSHRVGHSAWHGASGEAYLGFVERLMRAADEQSGPAADAAEKLRAYAGQLERMQHAFADLRDDARAGGLVVAGTIIQPPQAPAEGLYCVSEEAQQAAIAELEARVALYNRIATKVGNRWGRLEKWIAENLVAFDTGISEVEPLITTLHRAMERTNRLAVEFVLEVKSDQLKVTLDHLITRAGEVRADAVRFHDGLRSGNPAVRAAAEAANPQGLRRSADALDTVIDGLRNSPVRHLPLVGDALSAGFAGQEIASGGSPSSVLIGEVGSLIGGIAVGAGVVAVVAALGVTAPVWVTAGAVVVGGLVIGFGLRWGYEEWVPQDVREAIDAGLEDAWDATTDFAADAWDKVRGGVGDAWNTVFG